MAVGACTAAIGVSLHRYLAPTKRACAVAPSAHESPTAAQRVDHPRVRSRGSAGRATGSERSRSATASSAQLHSPATSRS